MSACHIVTKLALSMLLGLAAGGCGGDSDKNTAATVTETVTVTAEPEAGEPAPNEPNIGDEALELGGTRQGSAVDTTVSDFRRQAPAYAREPDKGERWFSFLVRTCVHEDAPKPTPEEGEYTTGYQNDFGTVDAEGNSYGNSASEWTDFPQPRYPTGRTMQPGECVQGRVLLGIPEGVEPVVAHFLAQRLACRGLDLGLARPLWFKDCSIRPGAAGQVYARCVPGLAARRRVVAAE